MSAPRGGRGWVVAGALVLLAGLATLGWSVRERARRQRATRAGSVRLDAPAATPEARVPPTPSTAEQGQPALEPPPAPTLAAGEAPTPGGGGLAPGSRPPEAEQPQPPSIATVSPAPSVGGTAVPTMPGVGPAEVQTPGTPGPPTVAVAPPEDRAARVRLTVALRDQLSELTRLQDTGDDKLAGALEETRARFGEMEAWARQQAVSAAEWAAARSELERLRKQPVEPPPRPR